MTQFRKHEQRMYCYTHKTKTMLLRTIVLIATLSLHMVVFATEQDTAYARLFPSLRWSSISPDQIKHFRIDTLDRNHINQLGELRQIESFSITGHSLTEIPEVLCNLSTLRYLDLSHNRLVTLPQCLSKLTGLEEIWLGYNPLLDLDQVINILATLPRLHALHLEQDSITTIPPSIARLNQLEFLDLSSNRFSMLPYEFSRLTQLNTLLLNDESITFTLDSNISILRTLPNLRELHIEGDHLRQLPGSLFQLPKLERLYAGNNPVIQLPPQNQLRNTHVLFLDLHNAPLPQVEIQRIMQTSPGIRLRF